MIEGKKTSKKSKLLRFAGFKSSVLLSLKQTNQKFRKAVYMNPLLRPVFYPRINVLYIEVSSNCNFNCKMCTYKKEHVTTGNMSWILFKKCVDEASSLGVKEICLHFGGESLLHPQFKKFLKYAIDIRNNGKIQRISWIDNGMLFNEEISNLVVDLAVDSIGFSIDGVGAVNDAIRLGAKYSDIEKNIKYLLKRRGIAKPEVFLSTCTFGKTEEQCLDIYREWGPCVDRITLIPAMSSENTIYDKGYLYGGSKMLAPPPYCTYPFEVMAISWSGEVTGCCLDYSFRLHLGDASKNSLKNIWRGSPYHALRMAALKNNFPPGPCRKCEFWKINLEPKSEQILDGTATLSYGYIYRTIRGNKRAK